MAFTLPDNDEASNVNQSIWMQTDINALVAALAGNGVVSGCAVTAQGTPDMTVAVAAGTIQDSDTAYTITGGNATITAADGSNPRIDLVCAKTDDTLVVTAGVAAANPKAPDIPASNIILAMVYVPTSDTAIETAQIVDKRVIVRQVAATTQKTIQTHTVLHSETLGAAGSFDVTSIDQTYDHLLLRMKLKSDITGLNDGSYIWINNDTTQTNYYRMHMQSWDAALAGYEQNANQLSTIPASNAPAQEFFYVYVTILDYAGSTNKHMMITDGGLARVSALTTGVGLRVCSWQNTAAINRITIVTNNDPTDEFVAGSYLEIIGLKNETVLIIA